MDRHTSTRQSGGAGVVLNSDSYVCDIEQCAASVAVIGHREEDEARLTQLVQLLLVDVQLLPVNALCSARGATSRHYCKAVVR